VGGGGRVSCLRPVLGEGRGLSEVSRVNRKGLERESRAMMYFRGFGNGLKLKNFETGMEEQKNSCIRRSMTA